MVRFLLRLYLAECPTNQGNCDKDVTVSLCVARMPFADAPYGISSRPSLRNRTPYKNRTPFILMHTPLILSMFMPKN